MPSYSSLDQEALESERGVLFSILFNYSQIESLIDIDSLEVDIFFTNISRKIFQAIKNSGLSNGKYDIATVCSKLKQICSSEKELNDCIGYINNFPREIHYFSIHKYLKTLQCYKIKRDLDNLASNMQNYVLDVETFNDSIEAWRNKFEEVTSYKFEAHSLSSEDAIKDLENVWERSKNLGSRGFLKTGYLALDKYIKAFGGGQFIVLASRPGIGKTTFALNLIHQNFPYISKGSSSSIGVFSLEMTTTSLMSKLLAIEAGLELNVLQKLLDGEPIRTWENDLIQKCKARISNLNLLFCDQSNITIGNIISTVKTWVKKNNLKLLIIDYLQLIMNSSDKQMDFTQQYQKIGMISRGLKILAMEMDICILALAQLNRKVEERRGLEKSPILSDLRESGSIEQDADIVMFLYESSENNQEENGLEDSPNSSAPKKYTVLKVAKNRNGPIGKVDFYFNKNKGIYISKE